MISENWFGLAPEDWAVSRIGSVFRERKTTVSDIDFPALSVTKSGVFPQLETAAKSDNSDGRKLVKRGDFVINSRSDRKGSAGLARQDGSCSVIYIVLEPVGIDARYAEYLLKSVGFQEEFYRWGSGIVDDLWSTRYGAMKQIAIPLPPRDEQRRIADFLDRELAEIDALIAKQEQLITTLDERRGAVISRAVTRGLVEDRPLRDSGVEWLGHIPEHWELGRLKHSLRASVRSSGLVKGQALLEVEEGAFVGYSASGPDIFIPRSSSTPVTEPGLVLSSVGARCGRTFLAMEPEWGLVANTEAWTIRPEFFPRFVWFYSQLPEVWVRGGSAQPYIQTPASLMSPMPIPSLAEQERIADFIDHEISEIDELTGQVTRFKDLLFERRQALISAAVTGKLEVST